MMREAELFIQADKFFSQTVSQVRDDHWDMVAHTTPDWTVRELVGHVLDNSLAFIKTLSGEDVPDLDRDNLKAAWGASAQRAESLAEQQQDPDRQVEGPIGKMPTSDFLMLAAADRTLHAWDLARAINADATIPENLVQNVYDWLLEQGRVEEARKAEMFGPELPYTEDEDAQTKLLAITGRQA